MGRLLLGLTGAAIATFALAGTWAIARQLFVSPQAALGVVGFAVAACVALGAVYAGVSARLG